jgi:hypothetical protein
MSAPLAGGSPGGDAGAAAVTAEPVLARRSRRSWGEAASAALALAEPPQRWMFSKAEDQSPRFLRDTVMKSSRTRVRTRGSVPQSEHVHRALRRQSARRR